jgi:peptide-methionine (S)-S-oxide reductase
MKPFYLILTLLLALNVEAKLMKTETATLAGGCFWGVEEILRSIKGVTKTTVGYTGGETKDPTYGIVKLGTSNHAESVEIEFDPSIIKYADVLGYFFRLHDPTTVNQQGNDKGTQYRSVIFYHSPEQKRIAEETIERVNASKKWPKPIVTQILPATKFYPAEEYHQDYLQKNPSGYTCHWLRN